MDLKAEFYVCRQGSSDKYYFMVEREEGGVDCYYGKNSTLRQGRFSNQIYYTHGLTTQSFKKQRGWRKKGSEYVLVFSDSGTEEWLKERAIKWGRDGSHHLPKPEAEPAKVLALAGWFNNAKD